MDPVASAGGGRGGTDGYRCGHWWFHVKPAADAQRIGLHLSPIQERAFLDLHALLLRRAVPMGMVSERDAGRLYTRHLLDSLTAATVFTSSDRLSYDLGSGAGLPGLVLAIALPLCRFVLVESRQRRAGFLELAAQELGLSNVEVVASRVEGISDGGDVVTARAFAPAARSWASARPLLRPGGRLVYFAGGGWGPDELEALPQDIEPPGEISLVESLETSTRLVIMSRT